MFQHRERHVPHLERGGLKRTLGRVAEDRDARFPVGAPRERERNRRRARRAERREKRERVLLLLFFFVSGSRSRSRSRLDVASASPQKHGGERASLRRRQRVAVLGEAHARNRLGVAEEDLLTFFFRDVPGIPVDKRHDHHRLVRGVRHRSVARRGDGRGSLARRADHRAKRQSGIRPKVFRPSVTRVSRGRSRRGRV